MFAGTEEEMSLINEFTQFKSQESKGSRRLVVGFRAGPLHPPTGGPGAPRRWVGGVCTSGADGPPPSLPPGACEFGQGAFLSSLFPSLSPENPVTYLLGSLWAPAAQSCLPLPLPGLCLLAPQTYFVSPPFLPAPFGSTGLK